MGTMKRRSFLFITINFSLIMDLSIAQTYETFILHEKSDFSWPDGMKMALSLTFDDARLSQIDKGIQGEDISADDKAISLLCHFPGQSQPVSGPCISN